MATFGFGARADAKRKAGSRRGEYELTLSEVRDIAGAAGRELSNWIGTRIRTERRFPSAEAIRERGTSLVREQGHQVPTANWLGA